MMDRLDIQTAIKNGITCLGIEFGSTRIKGVLIDYSGNVLATGDYEWENSLVDGIWTYDLQDVDTGLRTCYTALRKDMEKKYGMMEPNFIVSSDWFDITSDTWNLNVDGVSIQFFIYDSHITVNASSSLGGMSADAISGNYYCLEQAMDLQ